MSRGSTLSICVNMSQLILNSGKSVSINRSLNAGVEITGQDFGVASGSDWRTQSIWYLVTWHRHIKIKMFILLLHSYWDSTYPPCWLLFEEAACWTELQQATCTKTTSLLLKCKKRNSRHMWHHFFPPTARWRWYRPKFTHHISDIWSTAVTKGQLLDSSRSLMFSVLIM